MTASKVFGFGAFVLVVFLGWWAFAPPGTFRDEQAAPRRFSFDFDDVAPGAWPDGLAVTPIDGLPAHGSGEALLAGSVDATDVDVAVFIQAAAEDACHPVAGLIARHRDGGNFHIVRIDTGDGETDLFRVADGEAVRIGSGRHQHMADGRWHAARLVARDGRISVVVDGREIIHATDDRAARPGRAGVWSSPPGAARFRDLTVDALR